MTPFPPTQKKARLETNIAYVTDPRPLRDRPDDRRPTPRHEPTPTDLDVPPLNRPDMVRLAPGRILDPTRPSEQTTAPPRRMESQTPSYRSPTTTDLFRTHDHGGNKTLNWFLEPSRPVLIIGDSNMGRLPRIQDPRVQVDCFPGARINNALYLLGYKTPVSPRVELVILHFGINDRATNNCGALNRDIRQLHTTACSTFPGATVRMAMLNIPPEMGAWEGRNIAHINQLIRETPHRIPPLREAHRLWTTDAIHWTTSTAGEILSHWRHYAGF